MSILKLPSFLFRAKSLTSRNGTTEKCYDANLVAVVLSRRHLLPPNERTRLNNTLLPYLAYSGYYEEIPPEPKKALQLSQLLKRLTDRLETAGQSCEKTQRGES